MTNRREPRSWARRAGLGSVAAGLMLAVVGLVPTVSGANGNNGSVKIGDQGVDSSPAPNSNDPHIDCAGRVEWYGFDLDPQTADVLFQVQAPTANTADPDDASTTKLYDDIVLTETTGPGGTTLDGVMDFDLSDLLASFTPNPQQGYHVKATITTTLTGGASDEKFKVFWVNPCEDEQFGGLTVDKVVAGTGAPASDTEFTFTLDCTLDETPIDLDGEDEGTQHTFTLAPSDPAESFSFLPPGAECTVAEPDALGGATTWTVDGDAATAPVVVTIVANTTVAVVATNTFSTSGPTFGSLSVAKATSGNSQPAQSTVFSFSVSCTDGGTPVDLNGDATGNDATVTRTSGQDAHELSGIPTGAVCSVTETDDQNADSTGWRVNGSTVADGSSVSNLTIGNGTTVTVVATNRFNTIVGSLTFGGLSVAKAVDGDDAPPAGTAFSFTVDCLDGSTPVDLNGLSAGTQASVTLTAGQAAQALSGIPTGSTCTVTETDDQDADSTTVTIGTGRAAVGTSASGVTIGNGTTVPVLFTNTFNADVQGEVINRPKPPASAPAPAPAVAGEVITRPAALARTGTTTLVLLQAGLGLILFGAGALIFGRERTASI